VLGAQVADLQEDPGVGEVYITGYPIGLFENADENGVLYFRSCEIFSGPDLDVDELDAQMVQRQGRLLNALIKRKAEEFSRRYGINWHYIDVEQDFQGHGYCAIETDSYWVKAEQSCRRQGDFEGTMHPNRLGHGIWAMRSRKHCVNTPFGRDELSAAHRSRLRTRPSRRLDRRRKQVFARPAR
jgi:hypothetical protein